MLAAATFLAAALEPWVAAIVFVTVGAWRAGASWGCGVVLRAVCCAWLCTLTASQLTHTHAHAHPTLAGSYIPLTIMVTEWRGNFRREMNRTDNWRSARVTDALLNW
jgi:hypothetical protein